MNYKYNFAIITNCGQVPEKPRLCSGWAAYGFYMGGPQATTCVFMKGR